MKKKDRLLTVSDFMWANAARACVSMHVMAGKSLYILIEEGFKSHVFVMLSSTI